MSALSPADELRDLQQRGPAALADLFERHRTRLERLVAVRFDPQLKGRLDVADVLQEAYLDAARRLDDYLANPAVCCFVWVRQLTWQTLVTLQRRQRAQRRDPHRERATMSPGHGDTTAYLVRQLAADLSTPSRTIMKKEQHAKLRAAIASMEEIDREMLLLRHFEHLSNGEAAEILGLNKTAASNRYVRALTRLKEILSALSDFTSPQPR